MKTRILQNSLLSVAAIATLVFTPAAVRAQEPTAVASTPPQLSYGVPQVLQLAQAKVGDGVIVSYIQNSGTIYALRADEIVYLKQQGVSDAVLNAMLNQRVRLTGSTEPATAPAASVTTASDQSYATTVPPTAYVQTVPSSTVYVIPDTQTYRYNAWYYGGYPYSYYDYYPYYGYNGYYGYPAVSFSFGFGNRWGGFHDRDGWRGGGGWYRSGGWHSTGGWHGGGGGWHR